jgi:hypothetical protein
MEGADDPVVRRLFDPAHYRTQIRRRRGDGLTHYLDVGWRRRLDPHLLFSTGFYLDENPDVAAAGVCPLVHFVRHGAAEGRDPHPLFDVRSYAASLGDTTVNPLVHFLDEGAQSRRSPHPWFDAASYLDAAPDVDAAGVNPLVHYLRFGWREGRRPHPDFDPAYYLAANVDVAALGIEPLTHYVRRGRREGRLPRPAYDLRFLLVELPAAAPTPTALVARSSRRHRPARRRPTPPSRPVIDRSWPDPLRGPRCQVLVAGVVLADRPNTAVDTFRRLAEARHHDVDQHWISISRGRRLPRPLRELPVVDRRDKLVPKYELLDGLLASVDLPAYDYVLLVDDDVVLPFGFLDVFLDAQSALGFALAQPARTATSSSAYPIVAQHPGLVARRTRFVEQGPVLSIHRSVLADVVPFDLRSPMGWGYENIWTARLEGRAALGIIDATPVDHSVRTTAGLYSIGLADQQRLALLASERHVATEDCMRVVQALPSWPDSR